MLIALLFSEQSLFTSNSGKSMGSASNTKRGLELHPQMLQRRALCQRSKVAFM